MNESDITIENLEIHVHFWVTVAELIPTVKDTKLKQSYIPYHLEGSSQTSHLKAEMLETK